MRADYYYDSCGIGQIRAGVWAPAHEPVAVVQLVHGIAEHIERYDDFAQYLCKNGVLVVAEDHMGHGKSIGVEGIRGYFHGGWFAAVEDTCQLMRDTQKKYPDVPYFLFGHSMGSFIVRTILVKYPDSGISGCIICGTGWQPKALLTVAVPMCNYICRTDGEHKPSQKLQKLIFGGYNKRVEHVRTTCDWLTRDSRIVDNYIADPLCGFTATAGLLRDMLMGISYIQTPAALGAMNKDVPVFFIAGGDDPVGSYGSGVRQTAREFEKAGVKAVSLQMYPLCRHEILNEINRKDVYHDVLGWIQTFIKMV